MNREVIYESRYMSVQEMDEKMKYNEWQREERERMRIAQAIYLIKHYQA